VGIIKAGIAPFAGLLCIAAAGSGCSATATASANEQGHTAASAQQAAEAFLEAFNALDAARFDRFFAEDATMFFPGGPFPRARVAGKAAVTAAFHRLFEAARSRGATRLGISPLDLQVQDYGSFAIASFHLRGNGNLGRRSIVLRRQGADWQIVHFHASALEEAP
jgi:ketosteroid isomerase-like protein